MMKKDLTLLVLAAGMGSRFGGLKQIEPVGPNGEFIIDYSIKDAIDAGFNKIVFVIKEENYEIFKNTIGKRIEDKVKVEYVFQKINDVPENVKIPEDRIKPLGTAHALYAARNVIHEKFATINADDFYGKDAYVKAAEFLNDCKDNEYGVIAYKVGNTLTENGTTAGYVGWYYLGTFSNELLVVGDDTEEIRAQAGNLMTGGIWFVTEEI